MMPIICHSHQNANPNQQDRHGPSCQVTLITRRQLSDTRSRGLGLGEPVDTAVDVACGTRQSAIALKDIATTIVGVVASPEIVDLAEPVDDGHG